MRRFSGCNQYRHIGRAEIRFDYSQLLITTDLAYGTSSTASVVKTGVRNGSSLRYSGPTRRLDFAPPWMTF